jgi:hypothetical protein
MKSEWFATLAAECGRPGNSQANVAKQLRHGASSGFPSTATLSQVLAGKYKGDVARIQGLVEGTFMGKTVECPVLGELGREICMKHQTRKPGASNPIRARLAEACKSCPNRRQS